MVTTTPHYLLFSQIDRARGTGRWQFELRSEDGQQQIEAADAEPDVVAERLDLLTVVRALEALDQPSRVTLVDCSDYVWKGVQYGLADWASNGWRWEFFGQMVPVKNCDLWQRMERALQYHDVQCRRRRFDPPHRYAVNPSVEPQAKKRGWGLRGKLSDWLKYAVSPHSHGQPRSLGLAVRALGKWAARSNRPRTVCS